MTELVFKGKEFVYNHHLAVPHRPLVPDLSKSVGKPDLSGNLVIQGDNLHALKALLPTYAEKVDCIFIDPPYNTGKESWRYNDNVNAPMIKEWLEASAVGVEDGLRHDKWCAMMWPRLKLLHELLAETGSFWMTLDDNESHRGKLLLDEIFGEDNFLANLVWKSTKSVTNTALVAQAHTHILIYGKSKDYFVKNRQNFKLPENGNGFSNPDKDPRGPWKADPFTVGGWRPNQQYEIVNPKTGKKYKPGEGKSWKNEKSVYDQMIKDNRIVFGTTGEAGPQRKRFLSEALERGKVTTSLWTDIIEATADLWTDIEATTDATNLLKKMFGGQSPFETPKPVELLSRIISIALKPGSLILDSFAGSGTTAHAVLKANSEDNGNRKFILVEMEENIADSVTAERIRLAIKGHFPNDKKIEGLEGSFTFCTLGDPIERDRILSGKTLPAYVDLAPVLFHMATNETLDLKNTQPDDFFVGSSNYDDVWMIYRPDLDWLKSDEAALTLSLAKKISETNSEKRHIVFASARFVSEKVLKEEKINVAFVPFPDALYRIEKERFK